MENCRGAIASEIMIAFNRMLGFNLPTARIRSVAWLLVMLSLIIGLMTRIGFLLHYVDFDYDQIRDSYLYASMRNGTMPTLGPPISGDFFYLPPLYYYIVFPFTLLGYDPTLQALPNAILSFLTIPLLVFALYRLLAGLSSDDLRLFWASVGGLWWSLMTTDIILATRDWNPSSAPFFMLAFIVIADLQLRKTVLDRNSVYSWAGIGVILAILISLHATTLYVMPVVFAITSVVFIIRSSSRLRAMLMLAVALSSMTVSLAPYWYGEIGSHWNNSQKMLHFTLNQAAGETPAVKSTSLEKIKKSLLSYAWLDGEGYFVGGNFVIRLAGILMLFFIVPIAYNVFRGNHVFLFLLSCMWGIFLFVAAFHHTEEVRYRLPLAMAPLFLTIVSLAFLDYRSLRGCVGGGLLAVGLLVSIIANARMDVLHATYVFGPSRLVAVTDIISTLKEMPDNALLCYANQSDSLLDAGWAFQYIDTYVTHRRLRFTERCTAGSFMIVPKFVASYGAGYGMGSDFYIDRSNYDFSYLTYVGHVSGPPLPVGSSVITQTEALRVVQMDVPQSGGVREK